MNLTLAIDDELLKAARKIATERDTTLNELVRNYLEEMVSDQRRIAREKLLELMDSGDFQVGPITWKREDLYDRGTRLREICAPNHLTAYDATAP